MTYDLTQPKDMMIDLMLFTILYPLIIGVPLGMFLRLFLQPFMLFVRRWRLKGYRRVGSAT